MGSVTSDGAHAGTSLWRAVNPAPPSPFTLQGKISTDVLIVGAGVAGLSLAWHLAKQQVDTVVLEAGNDEGMAATGDSAGIVAPQLARTTPGKVLKDFGADGGGRLLRLIAESGRYTFDLIEQLQISCGARRAGFISPTAARDGARIQSQIVEEWQPFRRDLRVIETADVRDLSGCRGYVSAIVDDSGGGLDPVAYCHGLAAAVTRLEVPLYKHSRVVALERAAKGWLARTSAGEVSARRVVLCANGGNAALHPALAQTALPLPVCEVATLPLPEPMRNSILPFGHTLTDSSADVFSIRFDAAHRLITACPGRHRIDSARINQRINRRLAALIPAYRSTPLEYIWQGTAWLNSSLQPRVLQVDEGLMAVQACNGRGIALNTIIGRELGRWLAQPDQGSLLVPLERPRPVAGFLFARYLPKLMLGGAAFAKRALERLGPRR